MEQLPRDLCALVGRYAGPLALCKLRKLFADRMRALGDFELQQVRAGIRHYFPGCDVPALDAFLARRGAWLTGQAVVLALACDPGDWRFEDAAGKYAISVTLAVAGTASETFSGGAESDVRQLLEELRTVFPNYELQHHRNTRRVRLTAPIGQGHRRVDHLVCKPHERVDVAYRPTGVRMSKAVRRALDSRVAGVPGRSADSYFPNFSISAFGFIGNDGILGCGGCRSFLEFHTMKRCDTCRTHWCTDCADIAEWKISATGLEMRCRSCDAATTLKRGSLPDGWFRPSLACDALLSARAWDASLKHTFRLAIDAAALPRGTALRVTGPASYVGRGEPSIVSCSPDGRCGSRATSLHVAPTADGFIVRRTGPAEEGVALYAFAPLARSVPVRIRRGEVLVDTRRRRVPPVPVQIVCAPHGVYLRTPIEDLVYE